ncbi:inositol monophosphatase family protein [Cellulomonas sp. PhB143]|uniref:inositol monophosphatase family protein n=1 Tax=Cellulomonas sp. PhB143 TaxID=2485186 RepID=UPI000F4A01B8|nr:inositol monophosphatase family protein [Cellulomonas sp. PhB143]ROS72986.1 myo-inositol-1(or 4)-monophosphatase [Cellulomonas sp. PhB143]
MTHAPAPAPAPEPDPALDLAGLRDLAVRMATEAGALVRDGRPERVEVAATKSSAVDVVTRMDAASEELLRRILATERPDDAVLGEEGGSTAGTSGLTWVLDPIDGTVNYLYGVGPYAVSVAVVTGAPDPARWTVLAGAVHDVPGARTWSAARGAGATLDGAPLAPRPAAELATSLVGTGFGYVAERRAAQARVLAQVLPRVRDVRRLGSAAVDLCLVASGALDLYYERGLNPWDMAAGALVAQEAGLVVTGLRGASATAQMTVAGRPGTVEELVRILEEADADQGA